MQKNILISIVIVIVIAIVILLLMRNPARAPIQSLKVEENGHQSVTGTGQYALNLSESTLRAQGQKPLLSGYTDIGNIALKNGNISVNQGIISGAFTVDMNSLAVESTGKGSDEPMLQKHLKSADFFDVEKYPESSFVIKSAEKTSEDDLYMISGDLTIKNITQMINFPAVIYMKDKQLKAEGSVTLDRTKWDIKYGSGSFFDNLGDKVISDIFLIEFNITADPQ